MLLRTFDGHNILGRVVQRPIKLNQGYREFWFQFCNFLARCSVYVVFPSVISRSNLKLHQTLEVKNTFKKDKTILQITFNSGLTLTGFRTTRPWMAKSFNKRSRYLHECFLWAFRHSVHGAAHVIKSAHNPGGTLKIECGLDLVDKWNGDLETASSYNSDLVIITNLCDYMQHPLSKTVLAKCPLTNDVQYNGLLPYRRISLVVSVVSHFVGRLMGSCHVSWLIIGMKGHSVFLQSNKKT